MVDLQLPCYESTRLSDYSFFYDGDACFGTKEYHQAWCAKELFRHFHAGIKQFGPPVDDLNLQEAFQSTIRSDNRYIDPASAEGSYILEVIKKANKILEDIRPPWQESQKDKSLEK